MLFVLFSSRHGKKSEIENFKKNQKKIAFYEAQRQREVLERLRKKIVRNF